MADLVTKYMSDSGAVPTLDALAATSNTAEIGSGTNTFLVLRNTNASPRTVTVVVPGNTAYGQAWPDIVMTLAATTGELWIPLRKQYADPNVPGRATFTVDVTAGVSAAVVRHS